MIGFSILTTAEITWNEFYPYLLEAVKSLSVEEMDSNEGVKDVWIIHKERGTSFQFSLINAGDDFDFLIQQERDELHLPFATLITVGVSSAPLPPLEAIIASGIVWKEYIRLESEKEDRLTLEIMCRLAEKWPVVVDTGRPPTTYYNNDDLFQRLQEGKGFFR